MVQSKRTLSKHRHAAPSAPWPWIDINDEIQPSAHPEKHQCPHKEGKCVECWQKYPQSFFPNWTPAQVERSILNPMLRAPSHPQTEHAIHYVDIADNGNFTKPTSHVIGTDEEAFWKTMQGMKRAKSVRIRALFVDDPSISVLKMIGQRYEVEPFFWSSSINWIPARYQEDMQANKGDHITIIIAFPRAINSEISEISKTPAVKPEIDTQNPLSTQRHSLVLDLLGVHVIRNVNTSTIISYQPLSSDEVTSARSIHSRVYLAGQSVYWNKIFKASKDPTFVLLTMLWYALFAWDQSLEILWEHISYLEASPNNITDELHRIRAYLLHYASLLEDFNKSVRFVLDTPNPAMASVPDDERGRSRAILERECNILSSQIERLSSSRLLWDKRLTNIMQLAFANVNIDDSNQMKQLTAAAVRDSAAMKQIAYLTMVFLPASFVATAFGMNIKEIVNDPSIKGSLVHYVVTAIPFTLATMWVVIALQGNWKKADDRPVGMLFRFWWPMLLVQWMWSEFKKIFNGIRNYIRNYI